MLFHPSWYKVASILRKYTTRAGGGKYELPFPPPSDFLSLTAKRNMKSKRKRSCRSRCAIHTAERDERRKSEEDSRRKKRIRLLLPGRRGEEKSARCFFFSRGVTSVVAIIFYSFAWRMQRQRRRVCGCIQSEKSSSFFFRPPVDPEKVDSSTRRVDEE